MRSVAIVATPLLAKLALAQELHTTTLTIGFTNSVGSAVTAVTTYTYDYSNPLTSFLTQTDSNGIVTGLPTGVTDQPPVFTSQPAPDTSIPPVATIPAGLPSGEHTFTVPAASGTGAQVFTASVGSSTTVILSSATPSNTPSGSGDSTGGQDPSNTDSSGGQASETPAGEGGAAGLLPASLVLASVGILAAALL